MGFEPKVVLEFAFGTVETRTTPLMSPAGANRLVGHGVGADTSDQMMTSVQEAASELSGRVIGVGHDREGLGPIQAHEQLAQLVQQGASMAVGPHDSFVDAGGNGNTETKAAGLNQQGDDLAGMAHDERGLGVATGLLMEAFDGGHFSALFGSFEAIDQHYRTPLHSHQAASKEAADRVEPTGRQRRDGQSGGVEEVQQAVVAAIEQTEAAHQAGDSGQVGAQAQGGQG